MPKTAQASEKPQPLMLDNGDGHDLMLTAMDASGTYPATMDLLATGPAQQGFYPVRVRLDRAEVERAHAWLGAWLAYSAPAA